MIFPNINLFFQIHFIAILRLAQILKCEKKDWNYSFQP